MAPPPPDPSPRGGGEEEASRFVTEASRFATSSLVPFVDARARCAAASPPLRRSQELSGGGCNPVPEPMPASPRLIAGFSSSASAGPIGCTSGRCALDLGVLPGFFLLSGGLAIFRIWDESGGEKRAIQRDHSLQRADADRTLSVDVSRRVASLLRGVPASAIDSAPASGEHSCIGIYFAD